MQTVIKQREPYIVDMRLSTEALQFAKLVTHAGESAIGVMGAVEATRAVMCAAISVALGTMERADVVDWLQRLATEVQARGRKPS